MKNLEKITTSLFLCCLLSSCGTCEQSSCDKDTSKKEPTKMVQTTESGLKYETLKEAPTDAQAPTKDKKVTVHYTGWLEKDGEKGAKFDSSVDRGKPFTFTLGIGQVIRGWDEGVAKMKIGEQCRLTIPADLGYGSRGAGRAIPPNATLIFDVELLEVA